MPIVKTVLSSSHPPKESRGSGDNLFLIPNPSSVLLIKFKQVIKDISNTPLLSYLSEKGGFGWLRSLSELQENNDDTGR